MHKFSFLFKINYKSLRTWISFLGPDKMIFTPVESVKPSSTARLQTWECTLKQSIFRALSYINAHCVGRLVNQNMRWLAIQENTSDDEWSECLYVWCVYQNKIYQSWIWILFFQGSIQCYEDLDQFITPRESDHYSCGLCPVQTPEHHECEVASGGQALPRVLHPPVPPLWGHPAHQAGPRLACQEGTLCDVRGPIVWQLLGVW